MPLKITFPNRRTTPVRYVFRGSLPLLIHAMRLRSELADSVSGRIAVR